MEVEGKVTHRTLKLFTQGVVHRGETLRATEATLISANGTRSLVDLELTEGKNREIRRMFETQDLKVTRLVRVQIGTVKLGELPTGKWRTLTKTEIRTLQRTQ